MRYSERENNNTYLKSCFEDHHQTRLEYICICARVLSHFSHAQLFASPWTVAPQDSPVHRLLQARIREWVTPPGDPPDPGIKSMSVMSPVLVGEFSATGATWEALCICKWKVKVVQSCLTLWDPMDYTVHGILLARILEWVAFPFSRGSSQPRDQIQVSCIAGGFFTSWATREAQEYWSG